MTNHPQIGMFLHFAKRFVSKNGVLIARRKQNLDYMASAGMTISDLENLILGLEAANCVKGPEADYDPERAKHWHVAVFNPVFQEKELYLKISIRIDQERCNCISVKLSDKRGAK